MNVPLNGYGSIPINTIFRGLFTSINPSYFDVNKKGDSMGFDTLPFWYHPNGTPVPGIARCSQVAGTPVGPSQNNAAFS